MCPFLEDADPQCASHLSLEHLDEALSVCADAFEQCPVYRLKLLTDARPVQPRRRLAAAG